MRYIHLAAFLAAYVLFVWMSVKWTKFTQASLVKGKTFLFNEGTVLFGIAAIFGFPFLLTGHFDLQFVAAYALAAEIGVVMSLVLNGLIGSATPKWGARWLSASAEWGFKNGVLVIGGLVTAALLMIAYPIAIGYYFYLESSGEGLYLRVIQCTLCIIFIPYFAMVFPTMIGGLASDNLDTGTRTRVFITQIGSLIPNAFQMGLLFWYFGISEPGERRFDVGVLPYFGKVTLGFSVNLMLVLLAIYVLPMLIAYLVGGESGKRRRLSLIAGRKTWIAKLADILDTPDGSNYLSRLLALRERISDATDEFILSDKMIGLGPELEQDVGSAFKQWASAFRATRDLDPRFEHLDALREIVKKIDESVLIWKDAPPNQKWRHAPRNGQPTCTRTTTR